MTGRYRPYHSTFPKFIVQCNLYATQDPNLKDWWWKEFYRQIIDVGALNRFWNLERAFDNYDVREEEFAEPAKSDV